MQVCVWIQLSHTLDELINELIVLLSANARTSEPEIQFIVEELLVLWKQSVKDSVRCGGISTSVPQSSTTGSVLEGWMPAHIVVSTSFATDMRMPPTPWSPIPRIYNNKGSDVVTGMEGRGNYLFPI